MYEAVPWAARLTELLRVAVPNITELHTTLTPVHWDSGEEGHTFVATFKASDTLHYAAAVHYIGSIGADPEDMARWADNIGKAIGTGFGADGGLDCRIV